MDTSSLLSLPLPHQQHSGSPDSSDTKVKKRRGYKACLYCRSRKAKCEFGDGSIDAPRIPPCKKCAREGRECILSAETKRGKWKLKRKMGVDGEPQLQSQQQDPPADDDDVKSNPTTATTTRQSTEGPITGDEKAEEDIISAKLQNPSDALSILSHVAERRSEAEAKSHSSPAKQALRLANETSRHHKLSSFAIVRQHIMSEESLHRLVAKYIRYYHPFIPLIMLSNLADAHLGQFAHDEPLLLSSILTIASRDEQDPSIHFGCWRHTKNLISSCLWGEESSLGAIESLLLLSEWMPRREDIGRGEGVEDRMSWMMVGNAVRLGYLLGLDQASFLDPSKDNPNNSLMFHRRILAWTYCYFMDRNISIRTGKAFWSRGPGPTLYNRRSDFPTLHPTQQAGTDYAKVMQAYLDLTQIVSNAHDILYPSKERTMSIITRGDYPRYLDDFARSAANWWSQWGGTNWHTPVKECLMISFSYLRLYINSFAFSATVTRTIQSHEAAARAQSGQPRIPSNLFPHGVGGTADARFIWNAVEAAKALIQTFSNDLHHSGLLRYIPSRFYLFLIYGQVFLLKAISTGAIVEPETTEVKRSIESVVKCLRDASVDDRHVAARYAHLLDAFLSKADKDILNRAKRQARMPPPMHMRNSPQHHQQQQYGSVTMPTYLPPLNSWSNVGTPGSGSGPSPGSGQAFPPMSSPYGQSPRGPSPHGQSLHGPSPPQNHWNIQASPSPNANANGPPSVDGSFDWNTLTNDYELDWANLVFGWPSMMMESDVANGTSGNANANMPMEIKEAEGSQTIYF